MLMSFIELLYHVMSMPKWKASETRFKVSLNFNKKRGYQATVPRPIITALGYPTRTITFVIKGKTKHRVELEGESSDTQRKVKTSSPNTHKP
jgi:hypothetical protein